MNSTSYSLLLVILLFSLNLEVISAKSIGAAPVAICQNHSVQLDATGQASILTTDIDNGSTGCTTLTFSLDINSFTCADIGNNTVTLTVMDANGMSDFCTATVTVTDAVNPTALCKDATLPLDVNGQAVLTVADIDNGSTDACGLSYITLSKTNFNCGNVGTNMVTLSMSDNNGNISICQSTVTVVDNINPTALCKPGPITVNLDANGMASITTADIDNNSSDNCGIASIALDKTNFTCSDLGINTVELSVTDVNGNTAKCTTTVDVVDLMAPVAMCKDTVLVLNVGGTASLVASQLDDGSTDNCTAPMFSLSQSNFDCTNIGNNLVVFTVTDANGNSNICNTLITIEDHTPPAPVCKNTVVVLNTAGLASITFADIDNGTIDECSLDTLLLDKQNFTCLDIGANTVTMTAIDDSGNSATCSATVTVQDNIAPIANCVSSISLQLDVNKMATVTAFDINNSSFDTCGINMMTINQTSFTCSDIGSNAVTLTVIDNAGLSATCTSVVNVSDNFLPMATCSNQVLHLDASGNGTVTASDIDNVSSNACSFQTMSLDITNFDCSNLGTNQVSLTVMDINGNTTSCNALVTVRDTIPPTPISQNIIVQLDATGFANITAAQINNGSIDACGISNMTLNETSFDCSEVGTNTVNLTVIDNSGNSAVTTADIIVEDTIPPTVICQNISMALGQDGSVGILASDIDNGSSDACGIGNLSLDKSTFLCSDLGPNNVVLTVTDNNGNSTSCTAVVTILDNVIPTAVCANVNLSIGLSGSNNIFPSELDAGSLGACSGFDLSLSQSDFDCNDVGTNYVVLTATNTVNGNSDNCISIVEVIDNVIPIVRCKDITVPLNSFGNAVITSTQLDNGSSDLCGIGSMSIEQSIFNCSHLGANSVKLEVTDVNGNVDHCFANVEITDLINPVAVCQNISVTLGANGSVSITPEMVGNLSSDNCGINTMSLDLSTFNANHIGVNTVNLEVEDQSGNTSICSAFVTVLNGNQPIAICQNTSLQLDMEGNAILSASDLNNGSIVSSGSPILSIDRAIFTCNDVGLQTVVLTVADSNGNSSACNATVNVIASDICNTNSGPTAVFIETPSNNPLTNVMVDINGVGVMTNSQGMANFNNLPSATSYTITPSKDINPLNGITTYDLVLMSGYILQTIDLDPYQVIAGDVNKDGKVSTFDLVQLRNMILYIILDFPTNDSWRFVDNSYVFPAPNRPNVAPFPESITTTSAPQGTMSFSAVKIGDLNRSANTSLFNHTNGRSIGETIFIETDEQYFEAGKKYKLDFKLKSEEEISAFQFTLEFDPNVLAFDKTIPGFLDDSTLFFGERFIDEGILTTAFYNQKTLVIDKEDKIFSLEFTAKRDGTLNQVLKLSSDYTKAKAFNSKGYALNIELSIGDNLKPIASSIQLVSNRPNPFKEETTIGFILESAQQLNINIFKTTGELVKSIDAKCNSGYNEFQISKRDLKNSGVYYYQVSNGKESIIKKMIHLN